jgi:hypothetical protein
METLGTYVIRVYRQDPAGMDGTVESVWNGEQLPFHSPEELWRALHELPSHRRGLNPPSEEGIP